MKERRAFFLLLAAMLISASCGSDTASSLEPISVEPVCSDSVSESEAGQLGGLVSEATAALEDEPTEVSSFNVGGATVLTRTNLDALPDKACVVRFASELNGYDDRLVLCLGGSQSSGSSRCRGLDVEGLSADGWTTDSGFDILRGMRTVTVAWPPTDGRLLWLADRPASLDSLGRLTDRSDFGLPDECSDPNIITDRRVLTRFVNDNPDRTAGLLSAGDGLATPRLLAIAVVEGHLEEVRAELSTPEAEPCLVPVEYSRTQLHAANDRLYADGQQSGYSPIRTHGVSERNNRVQVRVDVADRNTAQFIVDLVDEPDLLQIVGTGEILVGTQAPMDPALIERSETPVPEGLRPATTMSPP